MKLADAISEMERYQRENTKLKATLGALAQERDAAVATGRDSMNTVAIQDAHIETLKTQLIQAAAALKRQEAAGSSKLSSKPHLRVLFKQSAPSCFEGVR